MTTTFLLPVRFSCDTPGCNTIASSEVVVTVNQKNTAKIDQPYPDYPEGWDLGSCPACSAKAAAARAANLTAFNQRSRALHEAASTRQHEQNRLAEAAVGMTIQRYSCDSNLRAWCQRADCREAGRCCLSRPQAAE